MVNTHNLRGTLDRRSFLQAGGANAQTLDAMPEEEQAEIVLAELARIRLATTGALELVHTVSWGRDPWARGAYAHCASG